MRERTPGDGTSARVRDRVAASAPLVDASVYRPGPFLALAIILGPVALALAGAAISLNIEGTIPFWLPLVLLLWVPCAPMLWLALKSVRLSPLGIAVGRPWQRFREIYWTDIALVERRRGVLRIIGADRTFLSFAPALLRDGAQLEAEVLHKSPVRALTGTLRERAQPLGPEESLWAAPLSLPKRIAVRPRPGWAVGAGGIAALAGAGAFLAARALPAPAAASVAALSLAIGAVALVCAWWLLQPVELSEKGVAVRMPFGVRRAMDWQDVELVERSSRWHVLRFRGRTRLTCPGPGMLRREDGHVVRTFLRVYCTSRRVAIVPRRWLA